MNTNDQNTNTNPSNSNDNTKVKKTKRVIEKLSLDLIKDLPGAIAAPEKKVERDQYFMQIHRKLSGQIGNPVEMTQGHEFATLFDTKAKTKNVGSVISIGVENSIFEIVLKITTTEKPANNAVPINNVFAQLKEDLDAAQFLHQGDATWKAKVNGTTVVEGHFK